MNPLHRRGTACGRGQSCDTAAGFLGIAAVALAALLLLWSLMPETHLSNRSEHL